MLYANNYLMQNRWIFSFAIALVLLSPVFADYNVTASLDIDVYWGDVTGYTCEFPPTSPRGIGDRIPSSGDNCRDRTYTSKFDLSSIDMQTTNVYDAWLIVYVEEHFAYPTIYVDHELDTWGTGTCGDNHTVDKPGYSTYGSELYSLSSYQNATLTYWNVLQAIEDEVSQGSTEDNDISFILHDGDPGCSGSNIALRINTLAAGSNKPKLFLITEDDVDPQLITYYTNPVSPGENDDTLIYSSWSDNIKLDTAVIRENSTGIWQDHHVDLQQSNGIANYTIPAAQLQEYETVGINITVNDTAGNIESTIRMFVVGETSAICGDGTCDSDKLYNPETEATCPEDCHVVRCGDGICEEDETSTNCPTDCHIKIEIQQPTESESFSRGDSIPIRVKLETPKGSDVQDAIVTVDTGLLGYGNLTLYDDGEHGDAYAGDAIYGRSVTIGSQTAAGTYNLTVTATKWGGTSIEISSFIIDPILQSDASIPNDTYDKGYDILISGSVSSLQNIERGNMSLKLYMIKDDWVFVTDISTDTNADFYYTYPIFFSDPEGTWTILINGTDEYNNTLEKILYVDIITPTQVLYYYVQYSAPPTTSYERGNEVKLSVYVRRGDTLITEANVSFRDPSGNRRYMTEVSDGVYEDSFFILLNATLGNWILAIQATKYENETLQAGTSETTHVQVEPMLFKYSLVEPTRSQFTAGETIDMIIIVKYENDTPLSGAIVTTETPSGSLIVFNEQDVDGYYSASYTPSNIENGSWTMAILAQDVYGNYIEVAKDLLIRENLPLIPPWGWIIIISVVLGIFVFWKVQGETRYYTWRYQNLKREAGRVENMKGIVEEKYFNRQIDQKTYTKLMRDYEEKTVNFLSKLAQIEKKVKKPKKAKKSDSKPKKR